MRDSLNITYKYVIPPYLLFIIYTILSNIYFWDYYFNIINHITIISKIIVFVSLILFILHKYCNYNCKLPKVYNNILSFYVIISTFIYYIMNIWFVFFNPSYNATIEFITNLIYSYLLHIYIIIAKQHIFSPYPYDINNINFCERSLISCLYYYIINMFNWCCNIKIDPIEENESSTEIVVVNENDDERDNNSEILIAIVDGNKVIKIDNECCICFNKINETNVRILECNHSFHNKCLNTWENKYKRNDCPLCRTKIVKITCL